MLVGRFIHEKITFADDLIAKTAISKISDGDVVLTYTHTSVMATMLLEAHKAGKRFRVVIVDSRPVLMGKVRSMRRKARALLI